MSQLMAIYRKNHFFHFVSFLLQPSYRETNKNNSVFWDTQTVHVSHENARKVSNWFITPGESVEIYLQRSACSREIHQDNSFRICVFPREGFGQTLHTNCEFCVWWKFRWCSLTLLQGKVLPRRCRKHNTW